MIDELARWLASARFMQRALETLVVAPENTLLILPSTRWRCVWHVGCATCARVALLPEW